MIWFGISVCFIGDRKIRVFFKLLIILPIGELKGVVSQQGKSGGLSGSKRVLIEESLLLGVVLFLSDVKRHNKHGVHGVITLMATHDHGKAGRGRITTIVVCYLIQHRYIDPDGVYEYVRLIQPRILLASTQRQAVEEYYHLKVKKMQFPNNIQQ
ncbi:putative protein-tyrosine phosphatase [Helianthus annuus]|uniref:Dual specificity phosphatase, protein-tyrosine phosphatase n=1 Tax=Helianthus annuus TaxID=4232 RepID=A0A251USV0_HELAN|nr:putative Dual specificity phosphatase, protein-tyrosine phosphatase [Helianthus annuus]KAJ0578687.1 putative protein-tyrosine phosphatase [Helianthus annuus]KAJ0585885.1 putative protein-tyrosine phosphatase [Helianthus annuus]KAJ0920527.1 putative protein-tyrosine phosphatase [Helianthus annuus]